MIIHGQKIFPWLNIRISAENYFDHFLKKIMSISVNPIFPLFSLYISGDLLSIWSFWVFTQWKCSRPACYSFDTVLFSFSYWRVTFFWHVEKGNILKGSLSFSRKYKNERHSFILVWLNQFQYKKWLIWFRICGNTSVAWYIHSMAIRVVEFSNGGYKIRKVFA